LSGETLFMMFFAGVGLYLAIGCVVAAVFVASRPGALLSPPADVSGGARLLLLPGAAILWPLVLARWLFARGRA